MTNRIDPPKLDIDARLGNVSGTGKVERRIVANLIHALDGAGWRISSVDDGETDTPVAGVKDAMELVFNLDEVNVWFAKDGKRHRVYLVLGNGVDVISDWTLTDHDDFNKHVTAFSDTVEEYE